MIILAIDPGSEQSAWCWYDTSKKMPEAFGTCPNNEIGHFAAERIVIEKIASYGMPVGETVFDTCIWIGRFIERFIEGFPALPQVAFMKRKEVVTHICGSSRAKDSNVIQALKDRFGEKGTKKKPGILYGIKADEWQALALAMAYSEINKL